MKTSISQKKELMHIFLFYLLNTNKKSEYYLKEKYKKPLTGGQKMKESYAPKSNMVVTFLSFCLLYFRFDAEESGNSELGAN